MNDLDITLSKRESEQIVLGAILLENDLINDCKLVSVNFYEKKHQELYTVMKELDEKGLPIEPTSIFEHVGKGKEKRVGGLSYIMELLNTAFTTSSFGYHQDLIIEYYKKRKVVEIMQKAVHNVWDLDADETMRNVVESVSQLEEQDVDEDDGHISKILVETYEWMIKDHGGISGAPTGFFELDNLTNGWQRQDLVIIGGRPSMGKTALCVQALMNYAENKGKGGPSAIFSLEMQNRALALRMISNVGHIDGKIMKNPAEFFKPEDWKKSTNAFGQLGNLPLHLFDKAGVNMAYIREKLRMMKRLYPGQHIVVMIDYLQLIQGDPKYKGNRTQEISEISRSLKRLARELDLTIIALSQLSRNVESRQDKRPMLSDLRESGQLEQDADVIAFLYRDDYYDKETDMQNILEVIVAKQRNGPIGVANLAFVKEFSKFVNIK